MVAYPCCLSLSLCLWRSPGGVPSPRLLFLFLLLLPALSSCAPPRTEEEGEKAERGSAPGPGRAGLGWAAMSLLSLALPALRVYWIGLCVVWHQLLRRFRQGASCKAEITLQEIVPCPGLLLLSLFLRENKDLENKPLICFLLAITRTEIAKNWKMGSLTMDNWWHRLWDSLLMEKLSDRMDNFHHASFEERWYPLLKYINSYSNQLKPPDQHLSFWNGTFTET